MTFGAPAEARPPARAIGGLLVAAGGLTACITLVWLSMRAVMNVGGACADGGPYVSAQPCPEGVALAMIAGVFGLFGFGALGLWAGAVVGGGWVGLPLLAWPGLFLSLGWTFLEFGVAPPEGFGAGPEWGWLIPGVLFVLMGGAPLVLGFMARDEIRSGGNAAVSARFGMPVVSVSRRTAGATVGGAEARARQGSSPRDDADVVDRLERLAQLRRAGDLTNAEYETAKAAVLDAAGRRG